MLGDYVVHFPLTDFAVSLLVVAAILEIVRLVLNRGSLSVPVDLLLYLGTLGAVAAVASGWWLVAATDHGHDELLSMHHMFAYGTLAAAIVAVVARHLRARSARFASVMTVALVVSALLASGAGFYGGKIAHPRGDSQRREMTTTPTSHQH